MSKFSYSIFDADPRVASVDPWPLRNDDAPDAEEFEGTAQELALAVLEWAVMEVCDNEEYEVGQRIFVTVWDEERGTIASDRSYRLGVDDFINEDVDRWDTVATFVACCYGETGDDPGDLEVKVGHDPHGRWYVLEEDEGYADRVAGPFESEEEATEAAKKHANEKHEGEEGEDADDMRKRLLKEAAGEPDEEGEWAVYWATSLDDSHVVDRYESEDAAKAAATLMQSELESSHPGGNLLCGYEVRHLPQRLLKEAAGEPDEDGIRAYLKTAKEINRTSDLNLRSHLRNVEQMLEQMLDLVEEFLTSLEFSKGSKKKDKEYRKELEDWKQRLKSALSILRAGSHIV